jgi:hypothetical protein
MLLYTVCSSSYIQAEILLDVFGKHIINFGMAWDRLLLACSWIQVNVVFSAMPQQNTTFSFELAN